LGTHSNGPTLLADGALLASAAGELPYLLKVLSAAHPLSLQTHPSAEQAADGFARGLYPDPNAKPELLVALTRFEAFCGVRPAAATVHLLRSIGVDDLADAVAADGPAAAIEALYRGALDADAAIKGFNDSNQDEANPEVRWVTRLSRKYPNDASVAVTLLLNYVSLDPGDALRLDAGNLHTYLQGSGIELLGASDNVLRGGLTSKHVDVEELLRTVDLTPLATPVITNAARSGRYPLPAAGVELIRIDPTYNHIATGHELTISLDGTTLYLAPGTEYTPSATTYVVTPYNPSGEM
jgi:mannose-6-phosphate isomerase